MRPSFIIFHTPCCAGPTVEFFLVFGRKLPIMIRNNPSKILKRLFISINLMWVASFASRLALMIIAKCIIVKIMVIQKALTNFPHIYSKSLLTDIHRSTIYNIYIAVRYIVLTKRVLEI